MMGKEGREDLARDMLEGREFVARCVYVCGCVGVWVCGCVGVWVCVRVCVCAAHTHIHAHTHTHSAGGVQHEINSWNYSDAEDERNERLLDKRWRAWRRDFEAQVRRHRPRWLNILDPPASQPWDFNVSFVDHHGPPSNCRPLLPLT